MRGSVALSATGASPALRHVGRLLLHAALVGVAAGVYGALFVVAIEQVQDAVLRGAAGYHSLRAAGEWHSPGRSLGPFRPWLLGLLPAVGALCGALIVHAAKELRGSGGGNAMIAGYHRAHARVRLRVIGVRSLATIATVGCGASGGGEGPTMQIGSAIGAGVASLLRLGERERRLLYLAGVAAGMAAVFRTPLGAALMAVEILYRDDFEAEALIPAIAASVVAHATVVSLLGQTAPLFGILPRFVVTPGQLIYFALLGLLVAAVASLFVRLLHATHAAVERLPLPFWLKPTLGGLALGALVLSSMALWGPHLDLLPGHGGGLLGSGYGELQLFFSPTPLGGLAGWPLVQALGLALGLKAVAVCFSVGSGGSVGDFAPSMVLGGLTGGLFGTAVCLLSGSANLHPGAFALVGMATFYGGIAHVPLASSLMACELAGSYDILVPLLLSESIAFVALRDVSLYEAQRINSRGERPAVTGA